MNIMHVPKISHRYCTNTLPIIELRFARQQIFDLQLGLKPRLDRNYGRNEGPSFQRSFPASFGR